MLLRSSSTPVLGSLLSSYSETPNNHNYSHSEVPNTTPKHASSSIHHNYSKLCYKHQILTTSLCNSSPISPSVSELSGNTHTGGFRRAQSEGNLEGLLVSASSHVDEFSFSFPAKKFAGRPRRCSNLEAIPSFSFHNSRNRFYEDEDSEEEEEEEENEKEGMVKEDGSFYDSFADIENIYLKGDSKFASILQNNLGFEKDETEEMYLARGLGIADINFVNTGGHSGGSGGGGGGRKDYRQIGYGGDGGGGHGFVMEEHYRKLLEENPCNPLYLRNYAQFLHQTKKDPQGAEEYYSRAILADPKDGEVLSQYAKLVWELHHDKDRVNDYFERAVQAAGEDSHVQAAYASFLWETDDEDDLSCVGQPAPTLIKEGVIA